VGKHLYDSFLGNYEENWDKENCEVIK